MKKAKKITKQSKPITLVQISKLLDGQTVSIMREMNDRFRHFEQKMNLRFEKVDTRFDDVDQEIKGAKDRLLVVETKLDTVMDELATRKEVRNLVKELKGQGIKLDSTKIFAI